MIVYGLCLNKENKCMYGVLKHHAYFSWATTLFERPFFNVQTCGRSSEGLLYHDFFQCDRSVINIMCEVMAV